MNRKIQRPLNNITWENERKRTHSSDDAISVVSRTASLVVGGDGTGGGGDGRERIHL